MPARARIHTHTLFTHTLFSLSYTHTHNHTRRNTKRASQKKRPILSPADKPEPTPPASPSPKAGPRQASPLRAAVTPSPKSEDGPMQLSRTPLNQQFGGRFSQRQPQVARRAYGDLGKEKEEAASRLEELLTNAEQMRAVAKARSAMHPKDCECLLCRAPYLLDAGDVLLSKMKPAAAAEEGSHRSASSAAVGRILQRGMGRPGVGGVKQGERDSLMPGRAVRAGQVCVCVCLCGSGCMCA